MYYRSVHKKFSNGTVLVFITLVACKMSKSNSDNANVIIEEQQFILHREELLIKERELFGGGKTTLSETEQKVNSVLLNTKLEELGLSYKNSSTFLPAQSFQDVKHLIEQSKVFKILQKLPKGASLHTHMLAGVSVDFIITNLTYKDNLYGCFNGNGIFKLRFLSDSEENNINSSCTWKSLRMYRKENKDFDTWLRSILVLKTARNYETVEEVWSTFKKIFTTLYDMLCYKPVFKEYVYQLLTELYNDNLFYTELRGTFMPLYDLENDSTIMYDTRDFFTTFIQVVDEFKTDHPGFLGVKYIHSIYRGVTEDVLRSGLNDLIFFKRMFPTFIAGFDFVGYEEEGKHLLYFKEELLEAQKHLQFFFHAGETNWFGHTDLNLADAILLNSTRLGHAFALVKHPVLLDLVIQKNIAIELAPISNQALWLIKDLRNHPAAIFLSRNVPVVICNDDPAVWDAKGLSYDWYMVFMAMTWKKSGLEVLKDLALNSINYSAMDRNEKTTAINKWEELWTQFLEDLLLEHYL